MGRQTTEMKILVTGSLYATFKEQQGGSGIEGVRTTKKIIRGEVR